MVQFRIRPATSEDLVAILALEQQCAEVPHWGGFLWHDVLRSCGAGVRCVLIAEAGAALAGFMVLQLVVDQAEIESLAVDARFRRKGLGSGLCRSAAIWAADRGAHSMLLEVRSSNHAARAFYAQAGYVENGCRSRYYINPTEDAVLMQLLLPANAPTP
jgi:ribosomal-protein-alanine N-acetyltransferase